MKQCKECGNLCVDEMMFCPVCGKRFLDVKDSINNFSMSQDDTVHTQIAPLLQRITLFLEDGEFKRADEYCERVLDMEPTNPDAYIDKLLVEFECCTLEQLRNQILPITNSKNYAKIIRFGNEAQKDLISKMESDIQKNIEKLEGGADIEQSKVDDSDTNEIDIAPNIKANEYVIDMAQPEVEEYYIDIYCPHCHAKLSYTSWQLMENILTCPMCDAEFKYDREMNVS